MEKCKSVASIGFEGIKGELWEIYTIYRNEVMVE
jgi:hypothetical protein